MNHSRQHKHVIAIALPFALLVRASAVCAAETGSDTPPMGALSLP